MVALIFFATRFYLAQSPPFSLANEPLKSTPTPACSCGEQCNKGSSPKVLIGTGGFETEIPRIFKEMEAKKKELQQFLDSARCDAGCKGTKSGPTVTMHIEPANPGTICSNPGSRTFKIGPITDYSCKRSSSDPDYACTKAKNDLREKLLDAIEELLNGEDPCPDCSYYISISNVDIGECYAKDSSSCRYVDGSMDVTLTCGPKRTTDRWNIWFDWSACLCCNKVKEGSVVVEQ